MESTPCAARLNKSEVQSKKSFDRLDDLRVVEADNKQAFEPITIANGTACLVPITPDSNRENGDFPFDCNSPLTAVKQPLKVCCFGSNSERDGDPCACAGGNSPQTPKDSVFDPFAAGPDDKAWAPLCKKYVEEMRTHVKRCLNFGSSAKPLPYGSHVDGVEDTYSDDEMFESVYENLLDAIVTKQTESLLAQISNEEWDSDACKTPPSAPHSNGTAETCPGAPMKPFGKSRKIDLGLCKKLEF